MATSNFNGTSSPILSPEKRAELKKKYAKELASRSLVHKGPLGVEEPSLDPNYEYYICSSENLHRTELAGWAKAGDEIHVGDSGLVGGSQGLGVINLKGGKQGILMSRPKELGELIRAEESEKLRMMEADAGAVGAPGAKKVDLKKSPF